MTRLRRGAGAVFLLALGSCRGCHGEEPRRDAQAPEAAVAPVEDPALCERELAGAAVGAVPGTGSLDALVPTCSDEGTLVVWTLRGHTLARLQRARTPGSPFAPPVVLSTGVDGLGPAAPDAVDGPLAWRSPTVGLEEEREQWWAGAFAPGADAGRAHVASLRFPEGAEGRGLLVAERDGPGAVQLLGSLAGGEDNPRLVRARVALPQAEPAVLEREPARLETGILRAWEPSQRVALLTVVEGERTLLRAVQLQGDRAVVRGEHRLSREHFLAVSRGVARGAESFFAVSEFALSTGRERCIEVDPSRCAAPGDVTVLRVGSGGLRSYAAAPFGLVESLAFDAQEKLLVLYVGEGGRSRAVRFDPAREVSTPATLAPTAELPPLDHPSLVRCGRRLWLVAEVAVPTEGATRPDAAVLAVPADCVAR